MSDINDSFVGPQPLIKKCNKHGYLAMKDIRLEKKNKGNVGYKMRCRICYREKQQLDNSSKNEFLARFTSESVVKCKMCAQTKKVSDYHDSELYVRYPRCRHCVCSMRHSIQLKKKYKITSTQYSDWVKAQNNVCSICKEPEAANRKLSINYLDSDKKMLSIDHDHRQEKNGLMVIRGLICMKCNIIIGMVKDSVELLRTMADYLEREPLLTKPLI